MARPSPLLPLLCFTPLARGTRIRVAAAGFDDLDPGLLDVEIGHTPGDVLVADLGTPPGGAERAIVLLDRGRTPWRALREAPRLLRGGPPRGTPAGYEAAWEFLVEPGLDRPRHLVRPGFATAIPAEYGSRLRRALKRRGLFYALPRDRALVLARPGADDLIGSILAETLGERVPRVDLRRIYVSDTGVMAVAFVHRERTLYLRIPFSRVALERLRRSHDLVGRVRSAGFTLAAEPVAFREGGVSPFHLEKGLPGRPGAGGEEAVAAALAAIRPLHLAGARATVDDGIFARHVGSRLSRVAARLEKPAALDGVGRRLRGALLGKSVLVACCHGDFKLGNCLFDGQGRVSGIVDWDLGSPEDLALVDVVNLHGKRVQERTGGTLAEVARGAAPWGAAHRDYFAATKTTPLDPVDALLFWWLDRVDKQLAHTDDPDGEWSRRHVLPLLAP